MIDPEKTSCRISPSKTYKKKLAIDQQELGRKLAGLKESDLAKINLDENLLKAIAEHNRLGNSHGAKKRHLQYIGKLMRNFDFDNLQHSLETLNDIPGKTSERRVLDKAATDIAKKILQEDESAIHQLLQTYPMLDRKEVRHLWRNWKTTPLKKKEIQEKKLIKYVRSHL
jgi:ribosome-associated protein